MRQGMTLASAVVWLLVIIVPSPACRAGSAPEQGSRHAPLPDERLGIRTAPLLLLSRPDVRADLGMNASQAEAAEVEISDLYVRAAALRGKAGPQAVSMRRAIDEAQWAWVENHLTPEQHNRLVQIDLQWEGPSSLVSRPVVADTLGLAAEQRLALKQVVAARDTARASGSAPGSAEQVLAKQALSQLTPEQKVRWRTMLGNPFTPRHASGKNESRTTR